MARRSVWNKYGAMVVESGHLGQVAGCILSNRLADDYGKVLDEAKKLCLEAYKAAT